MPDWDPATYLQFAGERARPFDDLVSRLPTDGVRRVADLGCGPGDLTAALLRRWPAADIEGVDRSAAMLERAAAHAGERLRFRLGDVRTWQPAAPVDVILSNATLQWVPGHRELLARWVGLLPGSGWLAFQVPGNFDAPSHRLLDELAADPRFRGHTAGSERPSAHDAATYLADLAGLGCRVDAWETTYLHVLSGPDPVFRWILGAGARPVLEALPAGLRQVFAEEYRARLRLAYPAGPAGTVLPFRRVFVVAQRRVSPPG